MMSATAGPIVVEQSYGAPVPVVWSAITDKDQMRQWFFEPMIDFRPEIGFETQFNVRLEDQDYLHQWRVTYVDPGRTLAYDWRYGGFPGSSSVVWELSETPGGTRLKFTHEGYETFPQDNPSFTRESCQAGWDYFLGVRLKAFLERPKSN
jgi:uncharacterized protein YndB with AHSA1/START domain